MKVSNAIFFTLITVFITVSSSVASSKLVEVNKLKPDHAEALLQLANQAMLDLKYLKAIGLYTKIVNLASNPYKQSALENLGLVRERNNQPAHAKAEYQLYLELYPTGEDSIRVKRRLKKLIEQQGGIGLWSKKTQTSEGKWKQYGNLYQFYYRNMIDVGTAGPINDESLLSTNINYTVKTTGKPLSMEFNFAATHVYNTDDYDSNIERITSMYFDMTSDNRLFDIKLGRQKNKTTSIFNRYDGIDVGYVISENYKLKLVYGYPVEFNEIDNSEDNKFYSMGLGLLPDNNSWNTYIYYLEQKSDNVLDRQEVAIDTKYQNNYTSFYSVLDYSLQFETLNFFLATLNQRYQDDSSLNVIANYRKSPFLTATNALQGQVGVSSLEDLLSTLTKDEVEQLSLDRTALYKSLSAYYTRYLDSDLQITSDVTLSNMSGTVASAGVEAIQDTGNEYSYSIGFIRNSLFRKNDINIINLRYSQLSTSDIYILSLSSKFRKNRAWQINPRLRYDARDYDDGHSSIAIMPSIRLKHKLNKSWLFEMDLTYEDKKIKRPGSVTTNDKDKLFYAGYIYTF